MKRFIAWVLYMPNTRFYGWTVAWLALFFAVVFGADYFDVLPARIQLP